MYAKRQYQCPALALGQHPTQRTLTRANFELPALRLHPNSATDAPTASCQVFGYIRP